MFISGMRLCGISVGERVLADGALLTLRFDEFTEEKAKEVVKALGPEQQAAFFALGCQVQGELERHA